jgi:hypothetical protein
MLYYAVVFLIIAIIAGFFGLVGLREPLHGSPMCYLCFSWSSLSSPWYSGAGHQSEEHEDELSERPGGNHGS